MTTDLITRVRQWVLLERSRPEPNYMSFGLSRCVSGVSDEYHSAGSESLKGRHRYTSGCPKKLRGKVQHALTILAREGIVFSRVKPEPCVARYEHGETDKIFRFRVTREQALRELKKLNLKPRGGWYAHERSHFSTKSLE